jgi:ATP-binding cassette subfamily B multidrug efflux pump
VYFIQNRIALAVGLASLLLVDFLQLLIPLIIRKAINLLTIQSVPNTGHQLLKYAMMIVAIALAVTSFRYIWRHMIMGHSRKVEMHLRSRIYGHMQTLSLSFFKRTKTGDLMARAINDINSVRMASGMGLVAFVDGAVLGTAAIGFMIAIDMRLTLIALIPAPVVILVTRALTKRMSERFESVQKTFADLTEQVRESFAGVKVIKAHDREEWEYGKTKKMGAKYVSENMRLARTLAIFFPIMSIFSNAGLAIVIWLGGGSVILGEITPGDFVAFIAYLNLLTWPMMAMGWVTNLIQRGSASMRRINRILEEKPEINDPLPTSPLTRREDSAIVITDLSLKFSGLSDYALKNISLEIDRGETVAVVGKVGSGKTTLLEIIPRLLNIPPGKVFVEGQDICLLPLQKLREKIGFVTQDLFLFSDTVRNNISFGRELTDEEIMESLHIADISEEIQGLEAGIDTLMGEMGKTLSGGQRQRLTIARALVRPFPILIMDDALSMVDMRTEEKILNRILDIRRNKTTLIVSHRSSTILRADRIIVLDKGRIVEQGTHNNLITLDGKYASLYKQQLITERLEMGDVQ